MEEQKGEWTGVWIPREILEDISLTSVQRLLYAEVSAFNECFMSNETLAKRCCCSVDTIKRSIADLKEKKYIIQTKFDGRRRWLKAYHTLSASAKCHYQPVQNAPLDNNIDNKKKETVETSELEEVVEYWNTVHDTKYRSISGLYNNYKEARKSYSLDEIKEAVVKVKSDPFWKDKMTPTILFRRKNPQGEPVDYIGKLLSTKVRSRYVPMN